MENYTLDANIIRALLEIAPKKDVRYYLTGVYLNFKDGHAVATNGHALFVARIDTADCENMIIDRDVLAQIVKSKKVMAITINKDSISNNLGVSIAHKPIDGKYPDYKRVSVESAGPVEEWGLVNAINCAVQPAYLQKALNAVNFIEGKEAVATGLQETRKKDLIAGGVPNKFMFYIMAVSENWSGTAIKAEHTTWLIGE